MKYADTSLPVDEISALCAARGLEIDGVRRQGTVLVLEPAAGAALPEASKLAEVAEAIEVEGVRYVTLGLGGYASQESVDE